MKIMPAVKAGAYGHGSVETSRAVLSAGADMLGVATVEEGLELRDAGIAAPILILGCSPVDAAEEIVRLSISATACDLRFCKVLSDAAVSQNIIAGVHLKVDTGMGRIGVPVEHAEDTVRRMASLPGLRIEGMFTHFPSADEPDLEFTQKQISIFRELMLRIKTNGLDVPYRHTANSGAILAHPGSYFDLVRPGIMLYGLYPSPGVARSVKVEPALSLNTRIVFLKEVPRGACVSYGRAFVANRKTRVATIPIGYADGYNRRLSNIGSALVRERVVPVIGRVCMDQTMLDVTDVPGVSVDDEVTLYGGTGPVSVEEIARKLDTIPYEIVCAISQRVPRIYVNKD